MKKSDIAIADAILSNAIRIERFTASEKKKLFKVFQQMQIELKAKLLTNLTDFGKARVNKLLSESTAIIDAAYKEMVPAVVKEPWELTKAEFIKSPPKGFVYDPKSTFEADVHTIAGKVRIGPKFFDVPVQGRQNIVAHELGHALESSFKSDQWLKVMDLAQKPITGDGLGFLGKSEFRSIFGRVDKTGLIEGRSVGERITDLYADMMSGEDAFVSKNYPEARKLIIQMAKENGLPLPGTIKETGTDLLGLAKAEAAATQTAIASIGLEASLPTAAVLKAMVSDSLIQGAPLADWWEKMGADTAFKFAAQVRQGVAQGETLQQVITRIVGSKKKGIVGIMEISHRHASTLVHDSIMQIANDARMATYKANADIMKGFEWLATLDGNTCIECMAYSGAQWDMKGNSIKGDLPLKNPPLHPNCRCVLTSLTKSYRELGLNIDEMPPGTRASDLGQVPADMSMDSFLRRHDTEYLNDLLGPGRAKLFQDGKITLRQLVDGTGRPLRLDELRKAA